MLKPDSDPGDKFNVNPAEPDLKHCLSDKPSMLVVLSIRYHANYAYQAHEAVPVPQITYLSIPNTLAFSAYFAQ
jgi:hypothetical protein